MPRLDSDSIRVLKPFRRAGDRDSDLELVLLAGDGERSRARGEAGGAVWLASGLWFASLEGPPFGF